MNKKKIATLLLVGTLVVSGGVLGTKAWFTSKADATSNLRVTMGTLKLENVGDDIWTVENKENIDTDMVTEIDNPNENNDYTNVRPGDKFVKTVTLKNVGSLRSYVTLSTRHSVLPDELRGMLSLDIYKNGEYMIFDDPITMEPKEEVEFRIESSLDGPWMGNEVQGPDENNNAGKYHQILVDFLDSDVDIIEIEGTQVNAPKK